jgi:hypothetical protein
VAKLAVIYQRETDDWRAIDVALNGNAYTGGWSYQIVTYGSRPTGSWTSAVVLSGAKGIDIQGLTVGSYQVFLRIDGQTPYAPVLDPIDLVIE